MTAFEPIAVDRPRLARRSVGTWGPLWLAVALTILITAIRSTGTVDSDVAWQLWIAGRIHAGANLYTDIIETNPPLWFWMAVPVERLSSILHVRIESVLVVVVGILVGLSLAATNRLIAHVPPRSRALLLCYGALALAAMPWMHVGQREQLALVATVPYAALIAARRQGQGVSQGWSAALGAGAALGFALKHYFLVVPLLLEIWLFAAAPRKWRPIRGETAAIVVVGVLYLASVFLFQPDFVQRIIPLLQLAYGAFGAPGFSYLFGPFAIVGLLLLGAVATQTRILASSKAPFAAALTVAAAGFAIVYFIQFKGWPYHALPLIGCNSLAIAALLAETGTPPMFRVVAPALLAIPLVLSAEEQLHPALPSPDVLGAVSGLRAGESVGFLTTETAIPWSVTLQRRYRYSSRYNGFWMVRAILGNEQHGNPDPRLAALAREVVSQTVDDFTCIPPQRIIVTRPRPGEATFDMLPFFERDPRFVALLSHYRVRSRTSLETYELASPLPRASFPCRDGV